VSRLVALLIVLASMPAAAGGPPEARLGAMVGLQRSDRSAWVIGPSIEITIIEQLSIRGETLIEFGDLDDPFGPTNFRGGDGPHVNHVMFGPVWRPPEYARYGLSLGAEAGFLIMHSVFAADHFSDRFAVGAFAQAGHRLGPLFFALQLRVDASPAIDMAGPEGQDVQTTTGRLNFVVEFPIDVR
jgi:hypothetical protein